MWRPGLSHAEYRAWLDARTAATVEQRVRVRVMDLGHKVLSDQTHRFVSGEVTIDVTRDVSRVLSLTLYDQSESAGWEPQNVNQFPRYQSRMVRVDIVTKVPGVGRWVHCPVFTGPVTDYDREGAQVSIVAESKERLALGNFGRPRTWKRKARATTVIRQMLREVGETRFGLPNISRTIPRDITVNTTDSPWIQASKVAKSIGYKLEYDATGRVVMLRLPTRPGVTIPAEWLAGPVSVDRQVEPVNNRWIMRGAKPKGSKKRVSADVRLPARHPLSAQSLARDGQPLWRIQYEGNSQWKHNGAARQQALEYRDEQVRNLINYAVDCIPLPHLAEWDLVRVVDPVVGGLSIRVRQATIPLDGTAMTIGSLRRSRRPPKRYIPQSYTGGGGKYKQKKGKN